MNSFDPQAPGGPRRQRPLRVLLSGFVAGQSRAPDHDWEGDRSMKNSLLPIALIVFGLAWLARETGWFSQIHMALALVLIVLGAAIVLTEGINRSSLVTGPILIYAGCAWFAYDQGYAARQILWPVGVVVLGILLFISRLPNVPDAPPRRSRRDRSET